MANGTNILILLGSLRAGSVNRQLAEVGEANAPAGVGISCYRGAAGGGLGDVPFYNEDIDVDGERPDGAEHLRAAADVADAVLIITPEYNGSIPATVKNAIDWLSRPYGHSAISGTPVAVIGAALGGYGGVWAHDETRKSLGVAGARVVEDVKLSLPTKKLNGSHPSELVEVVAEVRAVIDRLAAEVGTTA